MTMAFMMTDMAASVLVFGFLSSPTVRIVPKAEITNRVNREMYSVIFILIFRRRCMRV